MAFDLSEWYNDTSKNYVLVSYKGEITADTVSDLLSETEKELRSVEANSKLIKKSYNVTVEALQNLYHHTENNCEEIIEKFGNKFATFFLLRITKDIYKIITGNFVHKSKIKLLEDRMNQINFLSKNELKILYKLILNNEEFSLKGGGGLGMIDIARKTGNKLVPNFHKYNSEFFFFSLEIVIS